MAAQSFAPSYKGEAPSLHRKMNPERRTT
ncbi:MAG: hypothetical protein K0R45_616, partial [Pseudomonas sp.]|nr:hypothetical protein [Pseudomonas sp.]